MTGIARFERIVIYVACVIVFTLLYGGMYVGAIHHSGTPAAIMCFGALCFAAWFLTVALLWGLILKGVIR